MTEKRYYCDDKTEYRSYGIFDLSKADKTMDDFRDEDGICSWQFGNYLVEETDSMLTGDEVCDLLNEQEETIQKQNQEITACYDTLTTIHELCDAVLNYDFKNVNDKVDFCHMLNEMDNKDLAFLKECFEAIRDNDLKTMTSLTLECKYGDVE